MQRDSNEPIVIEQESSGTMVRFVHNWPRNFNLGDYLCSPRHYFSFECWSPETTGVADIGVFGGGAFNDLGAARAELAQNHVSIAWGIGRSLQENPSPTETQKLAAGYAASGWRDRDITRVAGELVPCPSAMLPVLNLPIGSELGLFLNQNEAVSGSSLSEDFGNLCPVFGTNALSEIEFNQRFLKTDRIITNSYHVAYWSILSGRHVCLIGYSSKFSSLYGLFDIESDVLLYSRGDKSGLRHAVETANRGKKFVRLENHSDWRLFCKKKNVDFAKMLVSKYIFKDIQLKDNIDECYTRNKEIMEHYKPNPI